ncbi:hypothetical protein DMB38_21385 [Streptomyces sp. WAC 06738]|uniref:hypothetical protein n=1 Tax=Streptomyces sp. WAC 06738 TaxID=2203210 RepID=UPI000F6CA64A|nr:hypothetical protein [Streptomyces sp. WAC 06738]AZM47996.1 hypothetical protein DMB38_21385 [Streptomyces sp. WAC 06738]
MAAVAVVVVLPLTTACSSDGTDLSGEAKPTGKYAGCDDPDITEQGYDKRCLDGVPTAREEDKSMRFGTVVKGTVRGLTEGTLDITPSRTCSSGGGTIPPGTWDWDSAVFDLAQARMAGGTLTYVAAAEIAHRWSMHADDTVPEVGKSAAK